MVTRTLNARGAHANRASISRKGDGLALSGFGRVLPAMLLSAVVMLTSGCGGDSGTNPIPPANTTGGTLPVGGSPPSPPPDPSAIIPTWFGVQANILQPFCVGCHGGTSPLQGLSWEVNQYADIVTNGHVSTEITTMREVVPFDPNASYMVWKLRGQGPNGEPLGLVNGQPSVRMPATGIPLDPALIDVIVRWISDGAPLGVPDDANSGGSSGPPPPVVGSWMYVWTEALQICTLCHSQTPSSARCGVDFSCPPKGVVLTADNYNGVVNGDEVRPGRLDNSKLWERVTDPDPDKRMPFELDPLTPAQLDIIRDWIVSGAPLCPTGEVCP